VGRIALLPGDPDRVPRIAKYFSKAKLIASHREYTTYGGYVGKEYVVAMSTGIGAPSAAIAVEELARLGVKVMIRVGTCGAIHPAAKVGSVIIADAAVRLEGTSRAYVMEGYPAAATPEVVMALKEGEASLGKKSMTGVTCSTDSFYVGQARRGYGGYFPAALRLSSPTSEPRRYSASRWSPRSSSPSGGSSDSRRRLYSGSSRIESPTISGSMPGSKTRLRWRLRG